jgi:hypothetical protein
MGGGATDTLSTRGLEIFGVAVSIFNGGNRVRSEAFLPSRAAFCAPPRESYLDGE